MQTWRERERGKLYDLELCILLGALEVGTCKTCKSVERDNSIYRWKAAGLSAGKRDHPFLGVSLHRVVAVVHLTVQKGQSIHRWECQVKGMHQVHLQVGVWPRLTVSLLVRYPVSLRDASWRAESSGIIPGENPLSPQPSFFSVQALWKRFAICADFS